MTFCRIYMNVLVFGLVFLSAEGGTTQRRALWTDCTSPSSPVRITQLDITPSPVTLPGNMYFSMQGYSNRTLGSSRLILSIERLGSWFNIPIPCLFNIGSCTYRNMCTMLDDMISQNWLGATRVVGRDIKQMLIRSGMNPGLCPQPPQSISITNQRLRLPTMPSALYWFAEGVYHGNVRVVDNHSGEELVCLDVNLDVRRQQRECSGWFSCLI